MVPLGILEAAYDLRATHKDVFARMAKTMASCFPRDGSVAAFQCSGDQSLDVASCALERGGHEYLQGIQTMGRRTRREVWRALFWMEPGVIDPMSFANEEERSMATLLKVDDVIGLLGTTGGEHAVGLALGTREYSKWTEGRRALWKNVALHLGAAWRLRMALESGGGSRVAEFAPDGHEVSAVGDAEEPGARRALREAVLRRERVRSGRRSVGAEELWPALVAGRWTILDEYTASGRRQVIAYENPPGTEGLRALGPRDAEVLRCVVAGHAGKWIAAEYGISEASVTRALQRALRCLGIKSISTLSMLQRVEELRRCDVGGVELAVMRCSSRAAGVALTAAEQETLSLIMEGLTAREIAQRRRVSVHTVRNQEASVYRKLSVGSRRELYSSQRAKAS